MKRMRPRGLGLWGATALCLALSGWVLLRTPEPDLFGQQPESESTRSGRRVGSLWRRLTASESARHALDRLGVSTWHAAGQRGRGLKVAVLDSGFSGYREALSKALPEKVMVRSFRLDGNLEARESQHGILCGEIIHALAPEAELLFANWEPERSDQFLEAVRWARLEGARVISCSIIMPTWSDGEGKGPVHEQLARELGGDVLFFASAGNTAQRHWGGTFSPGKDGWHRWAFGHADNRIAPLGGEKMSLEVYGPAGCAYEVVVRDTATGRDLARAATAANGTSVRAVLHFQPVEGHACAVRVRAAAAGSKPGTFHVVALGAKLQYSVRRGSVPFPGDGAEVVAVGAADALGRCLSYSACGPCGGQGKPDLAAPVPFPSRWRSDQPFTGTSAAAPQGAALAALVWARNPAWTAKQVRSALQQAARRPALARLAGETGDGLLHLP
jgi:hypothetical protein